MHYYCAMYRITLIVTLKHSDPTVKYRRIFPVESLSKVANPWKGVTLNRCIIVAMIVVAVSSGVEKVQGEFLNVSYAINMCVSVLYVQILHSEGRYCKIT